MTQRRHEAGAQSGFILAARITSAHFFVSSATNLAKSDGEFWKGVPANSTNRVLILVSSSAALISAFSCVMISDGVFVGVANPYNCSWHIRQHARPRRECSAALPSASLWSRPVRAICRLGYIEWKPLRAASSQFSLQCLTYRVCERL
jgi:hypothetical protein